jgi:uncharacterized protein (DUF433 family)
VKVIPTEWKRESFFILAEAAAITGRPLKAVNNALDKGIAARARRKRGIAAMRLVDATALVYLRLERELVADTTPSFRRKLYKAIGAALAQGDNSVAVGALSVDLRPPLREVRQHLKDLRRCERLVVLDPEILGGVPVFHGTRIPVRMIADLSSQGETPGTLHEGYPRLTEEMIRLASIYAAAHPLRDRTRKQPWTESRNGRVIRVPLADAAAP